MSRPTKIRMPRSREQYILDSLERTFPTGEWVEEREGSVSHSKEIPTQDMGEAPGGAENGSESLTGAYLTVIGGQKYDTRELMRSIPLDHQIVVGAGRGVESDLAKWGNGEVICIPVNPDLYGKAARKVNVEQVLSFAPTSPLLLVGTGERVKQAKQWLKRARWTREVIELG